MYTNTMEFPILLEKGERGGGEGRGREEEERRVSRIRGINAREYILSVVLETDIHDSPSSCPCHSPPIPSTLGTLSAFISSADTYVLFPYPTAGYDLLII